MKVVASMLRRHGTIEPKGRGVVLSSLDPAYRSGRTIFPSRVFDVDEVQRVLKSGHQSRKIGAFVTKGARKAWPIFTLTLEERATCPSSCKAWGICYGNNMQAAERIVAGPELEAALSRELGALQVKHPNGFLVRLHVLGDFYSEAYVRFWEMALDAYPALAVFGFTAHLPQSDIGEAVYALGDAAPTRFSIRFSGLAQAHRGAVLEGDPGFEKAIVCPAQTGATDCCATCALCWQSTRSIGFRKH